MMTLYKTFSFNVHSVFFFQYYLKGKGWVDKARNIFRNLISLLSLRYIFTFSSYLLLFLHLVICPTKDYVNLIIIDGFM